MIAKRTGELHREVVLNNNSQNQNQMHSGGGGRGTISVQFLEKKRRKTWYRMPSGDEEVCWERWTVKVTVAEPKTETGTEPFSPPTFPSPPLVAVGKQEKSAICVCVCIY